MAIKKPKHLYSLLALATFLMCCVGSGGFPTSAAASSKLYVPSGFSEEVDGFSIAPSGSLSALPGSPFEDEIAPIGTAATPDGKYLYVTNFESGDVSAYAIAADGGLTPVAGSPFDAGVWPWGVAVTPDGRHLFVANDGSDNVSAYSIAADGSLTQVAGSPFKTGSARGGTLPTGLAVTPDGNYLYVTNQNANFVTAFAIAPDGGLAEVAGSPFPTGVTPREATITPDGKYLYVGNESSEYISAYAIGFDGSLSPLSGSPFSTEGHPTGVTVTPDGKYLYATHDGWNERVIWGYSIAADGSLSVLPGAPFATGGVRSHSIAVSPDSKHLYATNFYSNNLSGFSIAADGSLSTVAGSPYAVGVGPLQLTITPDQGPTAEFSATPTPAGDPSQLDASTSTDPDGVVASYRWDFGDGQTQVTSTPIAKHTYAAAGEYTVTLTVADDAGCSTGQVFTGQTVSCNGSPQAQTAHQVVVPPGIPLNVSAAGSGSGSVTSAPSGIACPGECSYAYEPGTGVTLTAHPSPGSTFAGWSGGGCAGTAPCQVAVDAETDVVATFDRASPPPVEPAEVGTRPAQLRIGRVRKKVPLRIRVSGTIARGASGVIEVSVGRRLHGRRTEAHTRARILGGRWRAGITLAKGSPAPLYVIARFGGSPGVEAGQARRRFEVRTEK